MIQKLTHDEIVKRQEHFRQTEKFPIRALLNNIRSLYNVGSMFRTADGAHLERLYLSGITGSPPHPGIAKTALGAEKSVSWQYVATPASIFTELRSEGVQILVLEQTSDSVIYNEVPVRFPCCLVVGNEISGVDSGVTYFADYAIEIPMFGSKNSLNVAVAFGIVAYELVRKYRERL